MPRCQAGNALAADAGIVTGKLVGQRMMAIGIIKADGLLRMLFRVFALAHEKIVGPEHVMGFDGDTDVLQVLRHLSALQADRLRGAGLSADHVVLGPAAQCDEALGLVGELCAQGFRRLWSSLRSACTRLS